MLSIKRAIHKKTKGTNNVLFTSSATAIEYLVSTTNQIGTSLLTINPTDFSLTPLGRFAAGAIPLKALVAVPEPGIFLLLLIGMIATAGCLQMRGLRKFTAKTRPLS